MSTEDETPASTHEQNTKPQASTKHSHPQTPKFPYKNSTVPNPKALPSTSDRHHSR